MIPDHQGTVLLYKEKKEVEIGSEELVYVKCSIWKVLALLMVSKCTPSIVLHGQRWVAMLGRYTCS